MAELYVDAFAGLAGDMLVAALVDAGAPVDGVLAAIEGLGVGGWSARMERVQRGPFAAQRFVVDLGWTFSPADGHDHGHGHDRGHDHDHAHDEARTWRTIRALLQAAALPPRARDRALAVFGRLAEAEAKVHGVAVDDVAFHEVGAVDSIVDIVGVCVALELLGVDRIVASPLPLGTGHTHGDHGYIPLPAPATLEVLRGWPIVPWPHPGETVTPTGAAVVAALAEPGPIPAMRLRAIGHGAGTRNPTTHPNVVRVLLGDGDAGAVDAVDELRANVDGVSGEHLAPLLQALLDAGAVDASLTPILMKKGRPGYLVTALVPPGRRAAVGDVLLRQGGTLGYRWTAAAREVLARRHVGVTTPWGEVRVKVGERAGVLLHAAPEHEDVATVAAKAGVSLAEVSAAAWAAWARLRRDGDDRTR